MKNQSYQERVQGVVEKMSKSDGPKSGCNALDRLRHARIAVAETAEAVRKALRMDGIMTSETIEYWLESEGLIPDGGQGVNLVFDPKGSVHNPDNPEPEREAGSDD